MLHPYNAGSFTDGNIKTINLGSHDIRSIPIQGHILLYT